MCAKTPNTITTLEEFREELERIRQRGYAYNFEEGVLEPSCVAAPIRNHSGEVVASMSLSVPAYRFEANRERYRSTLVATVEEVSRNLGYTKAIRMAGKARKEVVNVSG